MTAYIALLRGINVGGKHKLAMSDVRAVVEAAGGRDVRTYVQSGNVVFGHEAGSGRPARALASRLEAGLREAAGFDVPVVLRTAVELEDEIAANPFGAAATGELHATFFADRVAAKPSITDNAVRLAAGDEAFAIADRVVYLRLPNGIGRSKLAASLARALPGGTTRNWRTVTTLAAIATG